MISMRRRLLLMLALILLVTQLISAFWLWHESQEQISFLVDETLSAKVRTERVDTEIAEAIASLLAPSLIMMIVTLLASFWPSVGSSARSTNCSNGWKNALPIT